MVNMRNRPFIVFVSVLLLIICVIHFYLLATHLENNRGHFLLKSFDMETGEHRMIDPKPTLQFGMIFSATTF